MDKTESAVIPFIAHEAEVSRLERINRRFFVLLLIVFFAFVATNAGWILYEMQYEEIVVTQDVDTGSGEASVNAAVVGAGDVIYGESAPDSTGTAEESP